jgi:hypothetical protein
MKHSLLDPTTLRHIVFDTLDDSDDFVLILERTDESASGIVVRVANDAFCRASGYSQSHLGAATLRGSVRRVPNSVAILCMRLEGENVFDVYSG